jgi:hypothetical protein
VTVIHRARGWSAVLTARGLRRSLPGDTPALVRYLHTLNAAGLLSPNHLADDGRPVASCPRCGRLTAVEAWGIPSVCTACRADWMSEQVRARG